MSSDVCICSPLAFCLIFFMPAGVSGIGSFKRAGASLLYRLCFCQLAFCTLGLFL